MLGKNFFKEELSSSNFSMFGTLFWWDLVIFLLKIRIYLIFVPFKI